jgi:hypothetical protein
MHLAVKQCLVMVDPPVEEAVERQLVIGSPAVGVDDRVHLDVLQNGPQQVLLAAVGRQDDADLAASLEQPAGGELAAGAPASLSFTMAAEVGLVDLDGPLELLQLGLALGGAAPAD